MNSIRYIGTKPKLKPETLLHKANVVQRKREVCKVQVDIENGCYDEQETQVYTKCICPTHPKRSFWSKIKSLLNELLP